MTRLSVLGAICLLLLAGSSPARAQQAMRPYADPGGWFSISVPPDWTPAGDATRSLGAAFIKGFEESKGGAMVRSSFAVDGPLSAGEYPAPFVGVIMLDLPANRDLRGLGETLTSHPPAGWAQTQRGETTVAGRDAFFQYATRGDVYAVIVFIAHKAGTGFLVMAGTYNTPDRITPDFGTISQILESLRSR